MEQETLSLFPNEQALEAICQWSNSLKQLQQRLGQYYKRSEARVAAFDYIQALLSPVERKNGWQMSEQVGYHNPYRFQNLLGRASWDEEKLCEEIRAYIVEYLDDGAGILAIDETCFLKKGHESAGVARQYCGLTGQIENCQVGVFLAYLSSWSSSPKKRKKAKISRKIKFATKTGLAKKMLQSAFKKGLRPAWLVADEVYSRDACFWRWLEQTLTQPYVLTVSKRQPTIIDFQVCYAEKLLETVKPEDWQQLSCGAGTKGERASEWVSVRLSCIQPKGFSRWFLFRRDFIKESKSYTYSYYQAFAPTNTSLETLVWVARQRWRIEECFQFGKSHLGLADYEVRSWTGWHRHTALVIAAGAFLSVLRFQLEGLPETTNKPPFLTTKKAGSLDVFKQERGLLSVSV
jgi:SRSO17 transposase